MLYYKSVKVELFTAFPNVCLRTVYTVSIQLCSNNAFTWQHQLPTSTVVSGLPLKHFWTGHMYTRNLFLGIWYAGGIDVW